jgi:ABC-type transport system substrate-binding protein
MTSGPGTRTIRLAILVIVLSVSVASAESARRPARGGPTGDRGDSLVVLSVRPDPRTPFLDPQKVFDLAAPFLTCCLTRTLMSTNGLGPDAGGTELRPDLASGEPKVSGDGLTWSFHIRSDLRYAPPLQAVEITAPDIIRAMERLGRPRVGSPYAYLFEAIEGFQEFSRGDAAAIGGLESPDPYTLLVHLTEPLGDLAGRMALPGTAPIAPSGDRQLGVAQGHDRDLTGYLVSSGPYMFEGASRFDPSLAPSDQEPQVSNDQDRWTLVRNPSWDGSVDDLRAAIPDRIQFAFVSPFGDDGVTPRGPPIVQQEMLQLIEHGDADIPAFGFVGNAGIGAGSNPDVEVARIASQATQLLIFNLASEPFDDLHVRLAIAELLDRARLRRAYEAAFGYGARATGHILPDAVEEGVLLDYEPYPDGGDLEAARAEMRASTYDRDADGICDRPACHFELPDSEFFVRLAHALRPIGLSPSLIDPRTWERVHEDQVPPISFAFWWPDFGLVASMLDAIVGRDGLEGGTNWTLMGATPEQLRAAGYRVRRVPSVDDRLDACHRVVGPIATLCWARLDQFLMRQVAAIIPFGTVLFAYPVSDRIERFVTNSSGVPELDRIAIRSG